MKTVAAMDGMAPRLKVLVADDDAEILKLLAKGIEAAGHSACAVSNGHQAWARIDAGEDFDLVIADIRMPSLDGIGLLSKVRRAELALPVALITGFAEMELVLQSMRLRAFDYLLKPFGLEQLYQLLERAQVQAQGRRSAEMFRGGGLQGLEQRIQIQSRSDILPGTIQQVTQQIHSLIGTDHVLLTSLVPALTEALRMALLHGNLELPPDLFSTDPAEFTRQLQQRENEPHIRERSIGIQLRVDPSTIEVTVEAERAFTALEPGNPATGLGLIQRLCNELDVAADGNAVTMRYALGAVG